MKKFYETLRTTQASLVVLLMGLFMFASNNLQAQTLILDQPDMDYAPDETVYITETGSQTNKMVSLNTL